MAARRFTADRFAVACVGLIGFGIVPAVFGWAAFRLSGLGTGELSFASGASAVGVLVLAAIILGGAARELNGAVGVVIDDDGIRRRGKFTPFSEFDSADEEQYGLVVLRRGRHEIRLATYLFGDQPAATKHVLERVRPATEEATEPRADPDTDERDTDERDTDEPVTDEPD